MFLRERIYRFMGWKEQIEREARTVLKSNMEAAVAYARKSLTERFSRGRGAERVFPSYSRTHRYRREREGLQTGVKDVWFSGKMIGSIKEDWKEDADGIRVDLDFSGMANRRKDQKDNPSNRDIAVYFEKKQGQKLLKLSQEEKNFIQTMYSIRVDD